MAEVREVPPGSPSPEELREVLRAARVVAVVGLSDKPDRDSHHVGAYLQSVGYRVIPVNPAVERVLGERSYGSLRDVPEKVDVVDVFRKPEAVPAIVDDAIAVGAKVVWMQDGVVHEEAAKKARAAGLKVVMDRCMLRDHRAMTGGGG
jgi:predicted CoA-binding protein